MSAAGDPVTRSPGVGDRGHWFDEARLGMFVHWDHASQRGWEISWPMVGGVFSLPHGQSVPAADYHALASTFDPTSWDPVALARLAARSGVRYVVFTARHHSGYAMFDTATTDHAVTRSPFGRDVTRELLDACREEGLRVGLYYSLSDWHHPDYPAWRDEMRPYVLGRSPPQPTDEQAARFRSHLMTQLRELLTGYGRIDVVWFDGGWERPGTWWRSDEIAGLVRASQPDALINDRLPGHGDFATPEQFVPPTPPAGRWEACLTMDESWGWNPDDPELKSATAIVHALCETAGRGGNLLLNVSPRGDGSLPPEQLERLDALGTWMQAHSAAIHGTEAGLEPWQFYGPSTRRGRLVHLFVLARPYETITVRGLPVRRVRRATVMASGRDLSFTVRTGIIERLLEDPIGEVCIDVPADVLDDHASVVTLEIDDAGDPASSR